MVKAGQIATEGTSKVWSEATRSHQQQSEAICSHLEGVIKAGLIARDARVDALGLARLGLRQKEWV